MKKSLYFLIPLCFVVLMVIILVPRRIQYEKTLNAVCFRVSESGQIRSLDPVDQVQITIDMEKIEYLLIDPDKIQGFIELSGFENASYKTETLKYTTGRKGDITPEREERINEQRQEKSLFRLTLDNWDEIRKYSDNLKMIYNEDMDKMLLHDDKLCKMYFCSESEPDLAELMAYFEGYYELSPLLEEPE